MYDSEFYRKCIANLRALQAQLEQFVVDEEIVNDIDAVVDYLHNLIEQENESQLNTSIDLSGRTPLPDSFDAQT